MAGPHAPLELLTDLGVPELFFREQKEMGEIKK